MSALKSGLTQWLAAGLLDEVRQLMAEPGFDANSPAMRAVGYRQAVQFLEGRTNYAAFRLAGIAATRQLAKRPADLAAFNARRHQN